jgi:hypothetical protein
MNRDKSSRQPKNIQQRRDIHVLQTPHRYPILRQKPCFATYRLMVMQSG